MFFVVRVLQPRKQQCLTMLFIILFMILQCNEELHSKITKIMEKHDTVMVK